MLGFLRSLLFDEGSGRPVPYVEPKSRLYERARVQFGLTLDDHEFQFLTNFHIPWGDGHPLHLLATPSSATGQAYIRNDLARAINAGMTEYGYHSCGDLIATDRGVEVIAFLKGEPFIPSVPVSKVPEIPFVPGETAFWLDPELWERTPVLPSGKPDWCWKHLPDYEEIARQEEKKRRSEARKKAAAHRKIAKIKAEAEAEAARLKAVADAKAEAEKKAQQARVRAQLEELAAHNLALAEQKLVAERQRAEKQSWMDKVAKLKQRGCIYSWGPCGKCTGCTGIEVGDGSWGSGMREK